MWVTVDTATVSLPADVWVDDAGEVHPKNCTATRLKRRVIGILIAPKGNKRVGHLLLRFVLTLLTAGFGYAQVAERKLQRGVVVESVVSVADASQSYSLYLPSGYDPKNKYPAIYAFDASGRGPRAAGIYTQAAEKYGYLVFASNNSRNGLDGPALAAALNAIWNDTNARFSIDSTRVLATGNSGGARVASLFAYSCKCVFGVIGAGAGFSPTVPTDKQLPFFYLGTTGSDDFNYPEVRQLAKNLSKAGTLNHVLVFDGGHQWPPPDVVNQAVDWYELQAMKAGRRAEDAKFIDAVLAQRTQEAERLLGEGDLFQAGYEYKSIIADFQPFRPTSDAAAKLAALEKTSEYRQAVKREDNEIRQHGQLVAEIMLLLNDMLDDSTHAAAFSNAREQIAKLHRLSAAAANSGERRVARRVINDVFVATFETALYAHERQRNFTAALANLELAAEASPKFAGIPYNQARISALKGDKKKALAFLQKAIDLGFKNAFEIENEKAFDSIRHDRLFVKLLRSLTQ